MTIGEKLERNRKERRLLATRGMTGGGMDARPLIPCPQPLTHLSQMGVREKERRRGEEKKKVRVLRKGTGIVTSRGNKREREAKRLAEREMKLSDRLQKGGEMDPDLLRKTGDQRRTRAKRRQAALRERRNVMTKRNRPRKKGRGAAAAAVVVAVAVAAAAVVAVIVTVIAPRPPLLLHHLLHLLPLRMRGMQRRLH